MEIIRRRREEELAEEQRKKDLAVKDCEERLSGLDFGNFTWK